MSDNTPLRISIAPIGQREISDAYRQKQDDAGRDADMDRRRHYRVHSQDVSAWVEMPHAGPVLTKVLDLTIRGAAVGVPASTSSTLEVGAATRLRVQAAGASPVEVAARVVGVDDLEGMEVLRLEFDDSVDDQVATAALMRAFNRRAAPRVVPDPASLPLEVQLRIEEKRPRVVPIDLSVRGVGVRCDTALMRDLPIGRRVVVYVTLPESMAPLELKGWIRNHLDDGDVMRVGIEFDKHAFAKQDPGRHALLQYVNSRLNETEGA